MNKLLKEILQPDTNTSAQLYRIGEPFKIVDQMGPLGSHDWVQSWKNFRNGQISNNDASKLWENVDAVMDFIGEQVYSKITNYIDNIADIDFCGLKGLKSMLDMIDYDTTVAITYPYPTEILELLDLLSINKSLLFGSNNVLNASSKNNILASLLLARSNDDTYLYPSLTPGDFRELWTSSIDLLYISGNDLPGLTKNAYHSARLMDESMAKNADYDTFFATPNHEKYTTLLKINIPELSANSEIVAYIDNKTKEIEAYTTDVSTIKSWTDTLDSKDGLSCKFIKPYKLNTDNNIAPASLTNYSFIKLDSSNTYYGINANNTGIVSSYKYKINVDTNYNSLSVFNNFNTLLYTQTDKSLTPNIMTRNPILPGNLSTFGTNLSGISIFDLYPILLNTPTSLDINDGPYNTIGTYSKSKDSTFEKQIYVQNSYIGYPQIFEQTYTYINSDNTITTIFELIGLTLVDNDIEKTWTYTTTEFNKEYNSIGEQYITLINSNIKSYNNIDVDGLITIQYITNGRKGSFYRLTTLSNGITEIFESPSVKDYNEPIPSYATWIQTTNRKDGLFNGIIPYNLTIVKCPSKVVWTWKNGNTEISTTEDFTANLNTIEFPVNSFEYDVITYTEDNDKKESQQYLNGEAYYNSYIEFEDDSVVYINTWKSTDTLNNLTLSDDDYVKYCSSLFKKVLTSIVTLSYNKQENENTKIPLSDIISYNISSHLMDSSLFSTALAYDNPVLQAEAVRVKTENGVPLTFNEQYNFDLITLGKKSIEDFTESEQNVLNWENSIRSEPKNQTDLNTKYYKIRELKVKEYFKFILNFNAYISNFSLLDSHNVKDYLVDDNYFEIIDNKVPTLWTTGKDAKPLTSIFSEHDYIELLNKSNEGEPCFINETLIDDVSMALAKLCLDIAKLRDDAKNYVQQIYKKGTWNLLRNYIIEFLSNTLFKNVVNNSELSGLINNLESFKLNIVEYSDNAEYFNIQSLPTSSYTQEQLTNLNPKYWESIDEVDNNNNTLVNDDITNFYYNTLGLRLVDENGIEIGYDNVSATEALKKFLTCVYSSGAVTDYTEGIQFIEDKTLVSAINKYSGTENGLYPFYNYKNETHPSYQIHEYIYGFTKYVTDTFALDSLYNAASLEYADNIRNNIKDFIDSQGNIIDKWMSGRYDFTGYNSNVENASLINPEIRNEGPFNLYALSSYIEAIETESFSENTISKYFEYAINSEELTTYANILNSKDIYEEIKSCINGKIYKVATDYYNNIITLYKTDDKPNTLGKLWFKPANYPLSIPLFSKDSSLINLPKLESIATVNYMLSVDDTNLVYDFDIDPVTNTLVVILKMETGEKDVRMFGITQEYNVDHNYYQYYFKDTTTGRESFNVLNKTDNISYRFIGSVITNYKDLIGPSKVYAAYTKILDSYNSTNELDLIICKLDLTETKTEDEEKASKTLKLKRNLNYFINNDTDIVLSKSVNGLHIDLAVASNILANDDTEFRNYLGYYAKSKYSNELDGAINAQYFTTNTGTSADLETFINIGLLDKSFVSLNIGFDLINVEPTAVYSAFTSNNYYPIFPISDKYIGGNNFYEVPQLKNLKEYKLQYIGKVGGATQNAFIYEQALPDVNNDNLYHTSAYHLVQTYRYSTGPTEDIANSFSEFSENFGKDSTGKFIDLAVAYYLEGPIKNFIDSRNWNKSGSNFITNINSISLKLYNKCSYTASYLVGDHGNTGNTGLYHNEYILNKIANYNIQHYDLELRILVETSPNTWNIIAKSNNTTKPAADDAIAAVDNYMTIYTFDFNSSYFSLPADTVCRLVFAKPDDPADIYYPITYALYWANNIGLPDLNSFVNGSNPNAYSYKFGRLQTIFNNNITTLSTVSSALSGDIIKDLSLDCAKFNIDGTLTTVDNTSITHILIDNIYEPFDLRVSGKYEPLLSIGYDDGQVLISADLSSIYDNNIDMAWSNNQNYDKVWVKTDSNETPISSVIGFTFDYSDIKYNTNGNEIPSADIVKGLTDQYYTTFINSTISSINEGTLNSLSAGIPIYTGSSIKVDNISSIIDSSNKPYLWKMLYTNGDVPENLTEESVSSQINYDKIKSDMVWLTVEQDKTVKNDINYDFAPNSVELSGKVISTVTVNSLTENYGKVTLDEGFDIGISYFISNNTEDENIDKRPHVSVFALAMAQAGNEDDRFVCNFNTTDYNHEDLDNPYKQTLNVVSLITGEIKKYTVNLDKFTAADNYEVKLTISRA